MNINLPSIDDLDQAQYIADFERNRRKTPFGLAQMITLQSHAENGGGRHADQLGLTIGSPDRAARDADRSRRRLFHHRRGA